jgi:uncharacterized protein YraI
MSIRSIVVGLTFLASAAAVPSVAAAQTVAYAEPGTTNCRAGPSTGYQVLTQVYGGTPVQILSSQRGWYYVSVHGRRCWMASSRLQFAQARPPVIVAPEPYYVPRYRSYPYFYGGPSFSFSFGDFDRHRHWRPRRDRDRHWRPRRDRDRHWRRRWRRDHHWDRD